MGAYRFGKDALLLYDAYASAGSQATTEMDNVRDLTLNLTSVEVDTTTRASTLFKSSKVVFLDASLDFEMLDEASDTALAAISAAYMAMEPLPLFPVDVSAGEGLDADWNITSFTRNEPLEGVVTYSVTAKINNESREPTWATHSP